MKGKEFRFTEDRQRGEELTKVWALVELEVAGCRIRMMSTELQMENHGARIAELGLS